MDFGIPGEGETDDEAGSFEEDARSDMEPRDKVSHDVAFKPRLVTRKLPQRRTYSATGIPTADQLRRALLRSLARCRTYYPPFSSFSTFLRTRTFSEINPRICSSFFYSNKQVTVISSLNYFGELYQSKIASNNGWIRKWVRVHFADSLKSGWSA